ncbi:PQQ-dependent sugar dehydrogenase [Pedobacter faecalis]|uniref:PQQ-dependent sugar dehydrogenase n=1 Tax=Pedobacter faecalis TaxID=3041495 RepID=UPI00254BF225|nr:PQQ-dependent sugar dehydrogenase [Pedobacter sp. ELA7]
MNRYYVLTPLVILVLVTFAFIKPRATGELVEAGYQVDTLADNLRVPWQIVFLPDSSMLFTEREGRVRLLRHGKLLRKPLLNLHDVVLRNKSGALGLCLHPGFSRNKRVYLASNYLSYNRMKLRIVRYELEKDTLVRPLVILKDIPANQNHTGCRLTFGPDKKLYITTGDADQPVLAQDLKAYNGKILRVNDDGTVPSDNPFVGNDTARKEIWSYGHRNPQGIAFQPGTGLLYESEHGPTGGDEINLIKKGGNYGWPGVHHEQRRAGTESPLIQYTPSIGPGEVMFYNGSRFPDLKGKLLVACLRGASILNLSLHQGSIADQSLLFKNVHGRIRSLVTGPDGYLYFSTSMHDPGEGHPRDGHDDMILRIRPSGTGMMVSQKIKTAKRSETTGPSSASVLFQQLCASCHGDKLQGTATAKALVNADKRSIVRIITNGITNKGMPAWKGAISKEDIDGLADFIISAR